MHVRHAIAAAAKRGGRGRATNLAMAQKKQRRGSWVRRVLFCIFFPFLVWGIAFVLWFYWNDVKRILTGEPAARVPPKAARQSNEGEGEKRPGKNRAPEKIEDEERRKLEEIIKRRS